MKKNFQVVEYLTQREVKLRLKVPVNVRLLKIAVVDPDADSASIGYKIMVEDYGSDDQQPAFILWDGELYKEFERMFPNKKWLGKDVQITRLPRPTGGKANRYKVALLKAEK